MSASETTTERLSDRVARQLQGLILGDSLEPGDRLPSERVLSEQLGVSRTVVREAVRSLIGKGLLEVRPGGGKIVGAPDVKHASELMTMTLQASGARAFERVHEVRRLLEIEIAGLAADRRTEEDMIKIENQLAETVDARPDAERWARADVGLHAAIAQAAHNALFTVLLDSMSSMLMELRLTAAALPDTPERVHPFHTAIVAAVRDGNRGAARRAMSDHMREAAQTYKRARLVRGLESR
jgi:GntR family transcriptional repressor for pyruvate dehydrogenase complex